MRHPLARTWSRTKTVAQRRLSTGQPPLDQPRVHPHLGIAHRPVSWDGMDPLHAAARTPLPPDRTRLADDTVALLRRLVRTACVNDGTPDSGQELAAVRVVQAFLGTALEHPDVTAEIVEPHAGRTSLIARLRGTDPHARSLALLGHLDVVPADASRWTHPPFDADVADGEIWGRGTVDMLTLTAAMVAVFRQAVLADPRPAGDLVLAVVADEEAGGGLGVEWIMAHRPDLLAVDDALTEQGGVLLDPARADSGITLGIGEKGSAPRRVHVRGVPGHGSVPRGARNAAGIAAEIVLHVLRAPAPVTILPHWESLVHGLRLGPQTTARLLDPATLDAALPALGPLAPLGHALTRMTVSPDIVRAGEKRNVIPGSATIDLDIRVLPGQTADDVAALLAGLLAPWHDLVTVTGDQFDAGSTSPVDTALCRAITRVFRRRHPDAVPAYSIGPGGSDGRFLRPRGTHVYGFGLFSRRLGLADFRERLHGIDERVDVDSVRLTADALAELVLGGADAAGEPA
ncbi:M20/M25/M40 family metallo-hydrolase [Pseudoclavibacter caeni]|uniref:M20/M25/M40 family metallo-hydrolase n=2 Tax=Pseudoclavibacter caeni TaxID=908846 RepID=A0A7C8BVJ1_9MICO|nr:M20/M25/M40 family metallo-hydrolase [Pseudoclavibacter caeni]